MKESAEAGAERKDGTRRELGTRGCGCSMYNSTWLYMCCIVYFEKRGIKGFELK
jgi:hypothetical protein